MLDGLDGYGQGHVRESFSNGYWNKLRSPTRSPPDLLTPVSHLTCLHASHVTTVPMSSFKLYGLGPSVHLPSFARLHFNCNLWSLCGRYAD